MINYNEWINRINRLLQVQRDRRLKLIATNFTEKELYELKRIIEEAMEYSDENYIGGNPGMWMWEEGIRLTSGNIVVEKENHDV